MLVRTIEHIPIVEHIPMIMLFLHSLISKRVDEDSFRLSCVRLSWQKNLHFTLGKLKLNFIEAFWLRFLLLARTMIMHEINGEIEYKKCMTAFWLYDDGCL